MKTRTWIALALAAGLVAGGALYRLRTPGSSAGSPAGAAAPARAGEGAPGATLEFAATDVMTLAAGEISRSIPLTGSLRPVNQTVVKSKVAGEIRALLVREGDAVRAGQTIARIDPLEFDWKVREKEAQLRAAEAQLEQARRTFENNQRLLEQSFISRNAFDNARFGLDAAIGNRDAAAAQLTVARKALTDTVINAPMAGIVAERFAQAGEKVSPDNRIVSIVDLSRMEIEAPVPASEIGAIRVGQSVTLAVEGIDEPKVAQVVRINPGTQAGTRSVLVYLGLDNRDPRVRAGLFAQGTIAVGTRRDVIAVPQAAVRESAGRSFVYLIADGRLAERDVALGLRDDTARAPNGSAGLVEVRTGLAAGERIVGVNLGPLRAGSPVHVAGEASSGIAAAAGTRATAGAAPAGGMAATPGPARD